MAVLEYKILALSLHVQRLEAILSSVVAAGQPPSLQEMRDRLSIIDGIGGVLPLESMTATKALEMLGGGPDPRNARSVTELLRLDV